MELIDTHCHLHFDNYDTDRPEVLTASAEAGVKRIICVGCSLADSQRAIEFAQQTPGAWASVGIHPHEANNVVNFQDFQGLTLEMKKMLSNSKVVAVGEIGLDYYRDFTPKADQEKTLRAQLEIGLESGLPFVFHVREAWDDFWKIFDDYQGIKGVIHSFSAGPDRLDQVLQRNLLVALNGLMTYTKDSTWLEAAKQAPLDKLVLETDAPFLTPVPYRGKRCEPKNVADTCRFLAELRAESPEQIAKTTTSNAVRLFGLDEQIIA